MPLVDGHFADGDTDSLKTEPIGLPKGCTLGDGTRSLRIATANVPVDLSGWHPDRLQLTLPKNAPDELALEVRASSRVSANGSTPESSASTRRPSR